MDENANIPQDDARKDVPETQAEDAASRPDYAADERAEVEARAEAAGQVADPERAEKYGPIGELLIDAEHEAEAELKGEDGLVGEQEMEIEPENIPAGQILGLGLVVIVAIIAIAVTMFVAGPMTANSVGYEYAEGARYPELEVNEAAAVDRLTNYGIVDATAERYRIPIDRAMDLMVEEAWREGRVGTPNVTPGLGARNSEIIERTNDELLEQSEDAREQASSVQN